MSPLASFIASHPFIVFGLLAGAMLILAGLAWAAIGRLRALNFFTRREWLWHLGLGFALVLLTLAGFLELADEIGVDEDLGRFDEQLAGELAQRLEPATLRLFAAVTHLGDVWTLTALCVAVAALLLWRRQGQLALAWVITLAGNGLLNRALKTGFQRTRPLHEHGWADVGGWSFPSGHSSGALVAYGMLAWLLIRVTPRHWHLPLALGAITITLLVGYSRIVLQVHWFSDVLAGYASGAAWLAVCIAGAEIARLGPRRPLPGAPGSAPGTPA